MRNHYLFLKIFIGGGQFQVHDKTEGKVQQLSDNPLFCHRQRPPPLLTSPSRGGLWLQPMDQHIIIPSSP